MHRLRKLIERGMVGQVKAAATPYYLDTTAGLDAQTGLSIAQAWKTIAKANGFTFPQTPALNFKRGETWREILTAAGTKAGYGSKPLCYFNRDASNPQAIVTYALRGAVKVDNLYFILYEVGPGPWKLGIDSWMPGGSGGTYTTQFLPVGAGGSIDEHGQSDPCALYESGTLKVWYSCWDVSDHNVMGYATSADKGITWVKYNAGSDVAVLFLGTGGSWDDHFIHQPQVIHDGSTYYMFYGGNNNSYTGVGAMNIGLATSSDGIAWNRYGSAPVIALTGVSTDPDESYVRPSQPFKYGSTWYMLYWGHSNTSGKDTLLLATSPDLYTWTKQGVALAPTFTGDEASGIQTSCPLLEGNILKLWFGSYSGSIYKINYAWQNLAQINQAVINAPTLQAGWTRLSTDVLGDIVHPTTSKNTAANYIYGVKIHTGAVAPKALGIWFYNLPACATRPHIKGAIYTYDSTTAGTKVASSDADENTNICANSWNYVSIPGQPTLSANTDYWICLWSDTAWQGLSNTTGTFGGVAKSLAYGAWPASFTGGIAMSFDKAGVYLVTDQTVGIWQKTGFGSDPVHVYQDNTALTIAANLAAVMARKYYWDGASVLSICCTDSADPNREKNIGTGAGTLTVLS